MMKFLTTLVVILTPATADAAWFQANTPHFRIYSEGKAETLRTFAIKVERFDKLLRQRFGVGEEAIPQPLTIFMLPSSEAVARISGRGKNVAGFYEPHSSGSLAVVNRETASDKYDLSGETVLFHEYAHHFMLRNFPVAYPAWYIEGFAEFISTTNFTKEGNAQIGQPPYYRAYGLLDQAIIPAAKLFTSAVSDFPQDRIDSFYGRSWLMLHYLTYAPQRAGQLEQYLRAINEGKSSIDAAKSAFGNLDSLDNEIKTYLKKAKISYSMQVTPTPQSDKVETIALSAALGALMPHRLALMRAPESEQVKPIITALHSVIIKYPTEADGFRMLAEAQLIADNFDAADVAADSALKLNPGMARAMMVKANVAIHRYESAPIASPGLAKAMHGWIVKANRADTNDPLPLIANYQSYELQGLKPSKTAMDGLASAYRMVAEDPNVRAQYASALARVGEYDAAIRLMETLAFDPHGGSGASSAREMVDRLKQAKADRAKRGSQADSTDD